KSEIQERLDSTIANAESHAAHLDSLQANLQNALDYANYGNNSNLDETLAQIKAFDPSIAERNDQLASEHADHLLGNLYSEIKRVPQPQSTLNETLSGTGTVSGALEQAEHAADAAATTAQQAAQEEQSSTGAASETQRADEQA